MTGNPETKMGKALLLIVRRGAYARYRSLKERSSNLRVVLEWDRRKGERRKSDTPPGQERRIGDRRRQIPPFTWDAADFLVAGETTTPDE